MSTKKITALTELSAAPAATDMIPVVDVSDTTDASSGTTKKITATNIAKGVGIGAGSTTVEPVKIDTSNGRLGVGTASGDTQLFVKGTITSSPNNSGSNGAVKLTADGSDGLIAVYDSSGDVQARIDANGDNNYFNGGNVGIGTTAPAAILETSDSVDGEFVGLQISNFRTAVDGDTGDSASIKFMFKDEGSTLQPAGRILASKIDDYYGGDANEDSALSFYTALNGSNTFQMRIDSTGNLLLGGTTTPTSSVGNLCLFNGTAPAASITNGVVLYAQDVSTSELKVRDEAGNIATLSPHNFDLLGDRSEEMAWSYSCKNAFAGKEVAVDMTKVIRALEKLTGEEYIKIRDIADSEKLDWDEEEKRKEAERKVEVDSYKERKAVFDGYPTNSSTKAEIKTFLDDKGISYEDAPKAKLLEKVPEFTEEEPVVYTKKSKPKWLK
jgi:hypothetical protein